MADKTPERTAAVPQADDLAAENIRLRAELAAAQRDQRFLHVLMDTIPDHIYFKDTQSRFLLINRAMAEWIALGSPSEALGKSDAGFFSTEHAGQALADERRIMQTREPLVGVEEKETWPTGGETWVSSTKVPVVDAQGKVSGICGISRDITRRKRAQQERERLIQELQQAMERIKTLHGLIPICAVCKRVRDDKGYWRQVETYVSEHSDATFSHGLCEECSKKTYPKYAGGAKADEGTRDA